MKRIMTLKAGILLGLVAVLLAAGAAYATHLLVVFNVDLAGSVPVTVSTEDPLHVFSGDGVTRLNSGDAINFGGTEVDFWGTAQTPLQEVFLTNTSNTPEQVTVTGASGDGLGVLFGTRPDDLKPAPDHAFVLEPQGTTGDTLMGWVGLSLSDLTPGTKQTTITFRATEPGSPLGPIKAEVVRDWGAAH